MKDLSNILQSAKNVVRHCPESPSVFLWPSQPSGFRSRPLPSSASLRFPHSGADWRRRPGRDRQSWLKTLEAADRCSMNLGLATAKRHIMHLFLLYVSLSNTQRIRPRRVYLCEESSSIL